LEGVATPVTVPPELALDELPPLQPASDKVSADRPISSFASKDGLLDDFMVFLPMLLFFCNYFFGCKTRDCMF
jgi:hypothetical protein